MTKKSLKQQITTVLSLILVVMAIAACAPNQALAKGKGRAGASASIRQRNNAPQRGAIAPLWDDEFASGHSKPKRNSLINSYGKAATGPIGPGFDAFKPKRNSLINSYSGAKSRGKQGH